MRNADHKHLTLQCRGEREKERERESTWELLLCELFKEKKEETCNSRRATRLKVFCTIDMHQARRFNFNYSL
jgi:uncharacterized protein YifE (UPF0438 family)